MLASIDKSRLPDPSSYKKAINSLEGSLWKQSVKEKITNLEKKYSWDVIPLPEGVKPIISKLVFKRKYGPDSKVNRRKARLVARDFQQKEDKDYDKTFVTIVKTTLYRILFTFIAILGWGAH
jgi:Reverse transcriptase (RNA-dependent DNA polymerase)